MKKEKCKCCKTNISRRVGEVCSSCKLIISSCKGQVKYLMEVIEFLQVDSFKFDKKALLSADNEASHKKIISEVFSSSNKYKYSDLLGALKISLRHKGVILGYNKLVDLIKFYRESGWIRNDRYFKAVRFYEINI